MSEFENSTASDGVVGLQSISNETYLHILRFLSCSSLAKAAQTSRLAAVLSMVSFSFAIADLDGVMIILAAVEALRVQHAIATSCISWSRC
jgi:hypothetical protein